jgi:hypothetical protein
MRPLLHLRPDAHSAGGLLCAAGLALLVVPARFAPALGVESLAAGFWWWARASDHPARNVPRWAWLRRPATALWLAAAIETVLSGSAGGAGLSSGTLALWWRLEAAAVAWAALELLAALPLARPFLDLPGPLIERGFWLPALLPAAGFLTLWRHAGVWLGVPAVREAVALLLLVTAGLAALRAFSRRRWSAGLRWLVVWDGALAGVLMASGFVSPSAVVLLWAGACGTHTYLLMGELWGATPRRGPVLATLWRATAWTTSGALAWPLLAAAGDLHPGRAAIVFVLGGGAAALVAWVNVARMIEAPERRALARPGSGLALSRIVPAFLLAGVPVACLSAWSVGFAPAPGAALFALVPPVLGGGTALLTFRRSAPGAAPGPWARAGQAARHAARRFFRSFIGLERALVTGAGALLRALATPLRDLHTGDAQEYVLFLVGVAVLAVLLPLLR